MAELDFSADACPPPLPPGVPRAGVLHVRHRHTDRYTVVGNHLAQHPALSAVAIGLAVHIQSLPDGASVTAKSLTLRFREGETTVRRALNELEAAGYVSRRRVPLGGGRFATRTFFYERPGAGELAHPRPTGLPQRGPDPGPGPEAKPEPVQERGPGQEQEQEPVSVPEPVRESVPEPVTGPVIPIQGLGSVRFVPSVPSARRGPDGHAGLAGFAGAAGGVLVRLRLADPRLLLSYRDVAELAPLVAEWLDRAVAPEQVVRALTAGLPAPHVPIHHPARFVAYRLSELLPPPLPPEAAAASGPGSVSASAAYTVRPDPMVTCDGCERAYRTAAPEGTLCGPCEAAKAERGAGTERAAGPGPGSRPRPDPVGDPRSDSVVLAAG